MIKKGRNLQPPSEEFIQSIIHSGSIDVDCELCGRYHFGNDKVAIDEEYGDGEFEKLIKKQEENPDKFVFHHDEDMVRWGTIDGKQAVANCICNQLSKYENFIWNNRDLIINYLADRIKRKFEKAKEEKGLIEKVKASASKL
jgi:hypothetical protein